MRKLSILAGTLAAILVVSAPVFAAGDFTIAAARGSAAVNAGNSVIYTVTATPTGGFSGPVTLAFSLSPPSVEVTISFAKNPLQPYTSYGNAYPDNTNMTVTTTRAAGTFNITVTGTSGSLSHPTSVILQMAGSTTSTSTSTTSTIATSTSTKSATTSSSTNSATTSSSMVPQSPPRHRRRAPPRLAR